MFVLSILFVKIRALNISCHLFVLFFPLLLLPVLLFFITAHSSTTSAPTRRIFGTSHPLSPAPQHIGACTFRASATAATCMYIQGREGDVVCVRESVRVRTRTHTCSNEDDTHPGNICVRMHLYTSTHPCTLYIMRMLLPNYRDAPDDPARRPMLSQSSIKSRSTLAL